ncbi:MAG: hypothetical protein WCI30_01955 [Clostridia bacterium]
MKVKIFSAMSVKGLEKQVNNFIEWEAVTVLKIQFSTSFNGCFVLIEYEEKKAN